MVQPAVMPACNGIASETLTLPQCEQMLGTSSRPKAEPRTLFGLSSDSFSDSLSPGQRCRMREAETGAQVAAAQPPCSASHLVELGKGVGVVRVVARPFLVHVVRDSSRGKFLHSLDGRKNRF